MKNTILNFNLLPRTYRDEFLYAKKITRIGHSLRVCVGMLSIFSLFLIFILGYLQHAQASLRTELLALQQSPAVIQFTQAKKEIATLNKELEALTSVSPPYNWADILAKTARIVPSSVSISKISLQEGFEGTQVTLEGKTDTQQGLVALEQALQRFSYASRVISPLSNYEKTQGITFTVSFILTPPVNERPQ